MTQAPLPITLNQIPPAPGTRNNTEFYAVYETTRSGVNSLAATSFVNNAWRFITLTAPQGITPAPAPMANCNVKSIAAGSDLYVVYMTSGSGLAVLRRGNDAWSADTPPLALTAIDNFSLFTDGVILYVLVNDNNTLKYAMLKGGTWTLVTLTGNQGKTAAPGPVAGSPLAATFNDGIINCAYQSSSRTGGPGFQALSIFGVPGAPAWNQADMIHTSALAKGVKFFMYNQVLFAVYTHGDGSIEVQYLNTTTMPITWALVYEPLQVAAQAPDVVVVNGGIFIVYPDTVGSLWATFYMFGWYTVPLTGASSTIMPGAPAAITSPSMAVYNTASLHICYNAAGNVVQDVFYVFPNWYQQQLYPRLPGT